MGARRDEPAGSAKATAHPFTVESVVVHGHRRAYVKAGSGPALLLLHGLGCDHTTWSPVLEHLARHHTVIAPDLLGHGASGKPRADYSVGGYANGMRDLLTILGIDRVTVIGHSLGGGVAMQFAYQYPERTERLVLVAPGGLGPEVSHLIRAVTLPGFGAAMGALTVPGVRQTVRTGMRLLARTGLALTRDLDEVADIYDTFRDPAARSAIRHVVRAAVDVRGQVITMVDRAYLTEEMPMLVVWGDQDRVIPPRHADIAAQVAPGAVVTVLADAGHFPHKDHPERFVRLVSGFIADTDPSRHHRGKWRRLMTGRTRTTPAADLTAAALAPVASA